MDSPSPEEDYRGGFVGPSEQALRTYLEQYLGQEDAVTPPGNAVPVDVIGAFVKFHKGNEVWGTYVGKSFVKTDLIDRLCDFFSYSIELDKRLHEKKIYMLYPEAQRLSLEIFYVGTVLAGLAKGESAQLYEALNSMLEYKRTQRKLKMGDAPVRMEVIIDSDAFIEGYNPSPGRIRSKVPRITHKMKQRMSAEQ
ncbi:hypothetical protein NCC49_000194 [Naganishia albida]|nr:hypothetical protein NCC49_000194 [Naganishia albida]